MVCSNNSKFISIRKSPDLNEIEKVSVKRDLFNGHYPNNASLRNRLLRSTQHYPVALIPIRLETRYVEKKLLIRIYPDQISINDHELRLYEIEALAGIEYHKLVSNISQDENLSEVERLEKKQSVWRGLAAQHGPTRASWLVKETRTIEDLSTLNLQQPDWLTVPTTMALPDHYAAFLYTDNGLWKGPLEGNPVPRTLAMIGTPQVSQEELFDDASNWLHNYPSAEKNGMAITVDLSELTEEKILKGFTRIVVVGLRSSTANGGQCSIEQMIENHHYSEGFSFLKYATPTNNTEDEVSGHSQTHEDREKSYQVEILDPPGWEDLTSESESNAQRLGSALGMGVNPHEEEVGQESEIAVLKNIENSSEQEDKYAKFMQAVIWPVMGDFTLRSLLPEQLSTLQLEFLRKHFCNHVKASGPLPVIRVGNLPYSILPVTSLQRADDNHQGWKASLRDNDDDEKNTHNEDRLHKILFELSKVWLTWSKQGFRVPRTNTTNDPDLVLLQILSMEPNSQSYQIRPFLCDRFSGWLISLYRYSIFRNFGLNPRDWVGLWGRTWNYYRERENNFWKRITGKQGLNLLDTPLLHMFGWAKSKNLSIPLVYGDQGIEDDDPAVYLKSLCDNEDSSSNTLLYELIRRAKLTYSTNNNLAIKEIQNSICSLATAAHDKAINLERLFSQSMDLHTNRLDAWITAHATKRLKAMRNEQPNGLYVGAYGWLEDLKPQSKEHDSSGYIHTPSRGQSAAAAVLHNAYLTHDYDDGDANPFSINLNSERVKHGLRLLEGVRHGQQLGTLLGYQFERTLHELHLDRFIDEFRRAFPLVVTKETESNPGESIDSLGARNVVDGLQLLRWWQEPESFKSTGNELDIARIKKYIDEDSEPYKTLTLEIKRLLQAQDCVNDLLTYEGVYQSVQGNFDRAGAALDAASGNAHPPEIESIKTHVSRKSLGHRVCMLFPPVSNELAEDDYRGLAEPRIASWLTTMWSDLSEIGCHFEYENNLLRININKTDVIELSMLPGLNAEGAELIIDYITNNGSIAGFDDLQNISDQVRELLISNRRWLMTGNEPEDIDKYFYRININSAEPSEIQLLFGISIEQANAIINHRNEVQLIRRLRDVKDVLGDENIDLEPIRRFATTGINDVSITELQLNCSDMLYLSSITPQGEETEIEQRIRFYVRNELGLTHDAWVEINMEQSDEFDYGLGEALELGQQVLAMLHAGNALEPGRLRVPGEADSTFFTDNEVNYLLDRVNNSVAQATDVRNALSATINQDNGAILNKEAAINALLEIAKFGVSGAIPAGRDDPVLSARMTNSINELNSRIINITKVITSVTEDESLTENKKIDLLIKGMKDLFSLGFIVLPEFLIAGSGNEDRVLWASELEKSFAQTDLLAGYGEQRIKLWLKQCSLIRKNLQQLEHGIMMTEAWSETVFDLDTSVVNLTVAQSPYVENNYWFALDDDERGNAINELHDVGRGYLSLVNIIAKGDSIFPISGDEAKSVAGLLIEQWDEDIPNDTVDTSVAFQYNAPGAQAPQSILLAVPGQRDEPDKEWELEELANIVSDTLDLAKIRTIDLDSMHRTNNNSSVERGVGQMFPATILPVDPEDWKWKRRGVQNVEDWADILRDL